MHRFFVTAAARDAQVVALTGDQAHQITRVLKLRAGEEVVLVPEGQDGAGAVEWLARLETVQAKAVRGVVIAERPALPEPTCAVTLCVAPLKGERFDWLIQKATELGVAAIQPMLTARTIRRTRGDESGALARWRRIATEAAEQSGRGTIPEIAAPVPVQMANVHGRAWIAHEGVAGREAQTLLTALPPDAAAATVFIGPEGGFAEDEVAALVARYDAAPVSLGPRVLRAETAAITAVTLALAATGNLQPPPVRPWRMVVDACKTVGG